MSTMIPMYNTMLFCEIYSNVDDFILDYSHIGIPQTIKQESIRTLFYLIYAKYGNNPIANHDLNQFKYKIFSIIFQHGPVWEKKMEIQKILQNLNEDEILSGSKTIYNHAFNPGESPTSDEVDELTYINEQNTQKYKKSKTEAYMMLWNMLDSNITDDFLKKFRPLFKIVVYPENPLLYEEEEK